MDIEAITVMRERYEELIKTEARMQFLLAYVTHEVYTSADILYYLGVSEKEEDHEEDREPAAE